MLIESLQEYCGVWQRPAATRYGETDLPERGCSAHDRGGLQRHLHTLRPGQRLQGIDLHEMQCQRCAAFSGLEEVSAAGCRSSSRLTCSCQPW